MFSKAFYAGFCGRSNNISSRVEATAVIVQHVSHRARQCLHFAQIIKQIVGHCMASGNDRNTVAAAKIHCCLANPHQHLYMDDIGLELLDNFTHL
jgi:hypothetical protein